MRHLTAQVVERLQGVSGDIAFPAARPSLVKGALGHRIADRAGLFDDRYLFIELDQSGSLHDGVRIRQLEVREMLVDRLNQGEVRLVDA